MMQKRFLIIIFISLIFVKCTDPTTETEISTIEFVLDHEAGNFPLTLDANGYYHMTMDMGRWQTTKTLYGYVYRDGNPMNVLRFGWASSHYWLLGDTLGYIVQIGLNDEFQYVAYDTTFITGFADHVVPCVNGSSYSREDGMVNTVIAPVRTMRGDTMTIFYGWYDDWKDEEIIGSFDIVLD